MSVDLLALVMRATLALSAAIVLVLALRAPLRAAFGPQIAYAFWALAPVAVLASFLPARTIFRPIVSARDSGDTSVVGDSAPQAVQMVTGLQSADTTALDWPALALALWLTGFVLALTLLAIRQLRFVANSNSGPAVIGVLAPRIVVPVDFEQRFSPAERALVLEHERAHIRAGDVQVNALAALLQCFNWFNPLAHIARAALRVDQELACDARVIARHAGARRVYAEAMLKTQLAAQAVPLGCAWPPIGAGPLKQRIAMLGKPAPTSARHRLGALACAAAATSLSIAIWAAQPARVAYAEQAPQRGANFFASALGAQLVSALKNGDQEAARDLIDLGANPNHWTHGDGTPLVVAAQNGDIATARLLLEAGADVNVRAPGDGNPLIVAADRGDMALTALFVEAGADVNAFVRGDETPLINAAANGQLDVAVYLIAHGADVNLDVDAPTTTGMERRSPLSQARQYGHDDMVQLLRRHGARR
ncbi:regulatory sensor-transducer of BlaR1/MecR1 family [alpha proteobacterium U9-1i]|nr:regulatory sensor-transducer of BlaR1/MecR1 family [alpha proteobacterium U9-1i]